MLRKQFQEELNALSIRLFGMGELIDRMLRLALEALRYGDVAAAAQVEQLEVEIDLKAEQFEAAAVELIATQQPVGQDLRLIVSAIKSCSNMERIADICLNIVEQARLLPRPLVKPLVDIPKMIDITLNMLQDSLQALVRNDVELAKSVWQRDDFVDELCDEIIRELQELMARDGICVPKALPLLIISMQIERIADHATNLAESVIFTVTGRIYKGQT